MQEITENELPQTLRTLWLKALTAVQTGNHDYAVTLLKAVTADAPGFLDGRKLLRNCSIRLHADEAPRKGGLFGIQGAGMGAMKIQSLAKKDPAAALAMVEKELEKDPLNEQYAELLFDIALKLEMKGTATFALETVRTHRPDNARLLHRLAEFYITHEAPETAAEVYNEIIRHHPNDGKALKGSKDAAARASMVKNRWSEDADMRALMRNAGEAAELEKESRSGLTREQLEERRDRIAEKYNQNPNHLQTVKELAAVYEQLEDWHNAQAFYEWAHSISQGDVALANRASQKRDRAIEHDLRALEAAAAADPANATLQDEIRQRRKDQLADKVSESRRKVEQNPTDPHLRYELGLALHNAGDFSGAIPHLQQATRNPHIRTKVLLLLGRTFKAKGMYDLAVKQLSDALADLHAMDSVKKEVLYQKGLIHEDIGDAAAALECFKQIYEVDYGYLDVARRVESSYA